MKEELKKFLECWHPGGMVPSIMVEVVRANLSQAGVLIIYQCHHCKAIKSRIA